MSGTRTARTVIRSSVQCYTGRKEISPGPKTRSNSLSRAMLATATSVAFRPRTADGVVSPRRRVAAPSNSHTLLTHDASPPWQDGQDTQQWAATVDGVVLTGATGKLVEQGHVAPNVTYVLGSNAHEGVSFHGLFRNRYSNQDKSTACNNFSDTSWSTYPEASYETCLEQFFAAPRAATKFYTDTTPCFYSSDAKDSAGLVFSDPTTPANFPVPKPPFAPSRCDATPYGIAPVYFSLPLSAAWYGSDYEFTCGNQYLAEKLREYNHTTYVYYSTALFYDPQGCALRSICKTAHAGRFVTPAHAR